MRLGRLIAEHRFDLEIFLEPEHAVLAAVAGLLVAAERDVTVGGSALR
jgi:hypothetical protein